MHACEYICVYAFMYMNVCMNECMHIGMYDFVCCSLNYCETKSAII